MSILNFGTLSMGNAHQLAHVLPQPPAFETPRLRRNRLARERRRRVRDEAAAPYQLTPPQESTRDRRNRLARLRYAQKKASVARSKLAIDERLAVQLDEFGRLSTRLGNVSVLNARDLLFRRFRTHRTLEQERRFLANDGQKRVTYAPRGPAEVERILPKYYPLPKGISPKPRS